MPESIEVSLTDLFDNFVWQICLTFESVTNSQGPFVRKSAPVGNFCYNYMLYIVGKLRVSAFRKSMVWGLKSYVPSVTSRWRHQPPELIIKVYKSLFDYESSPNLYFIRSLVMGLIKYIQNNSFKPISWKTSPFPLFMVTINAIFSSKLDIICRNFEVNSIFLQKKDPSLLFHIAVDRVESPISTIFIFWRLITHVLYHPWRQRDVATADI